MRCAIIVFPGSNCDRDCYHVMSEVHGVATQYVWHKATQLPPVDCVIMPGGFSYGDYLRAGAIAHCAPIMPVIKAFAAAGGPVLGICNGFQILTEVGLLPGALLRNASLKFECRDVYLRVENMETPFTRAFAKPSSVVSRQSSERQSPVAGRQSSQLPLSVVGALSSVTPKTEYRAPSTEHQPATGDRRPTTVVRMPIAHMDGNYYIDAATLAVMERQGQIVFRYCDRDGAVTAAANPNGSLQNIAGVCNRERNVVGLMPHPERCCEAVLGGTDGKGAFASLLGMS